LLNIFPIEGDSGNAEKMLFMGMDVTNEIMVERQMLQDNKMIAVGQLAAGVAHEIRNPLGLIRNYCYVIKTIDDEKIRAEAIEQIEKSVDSSNKIITNLLGFSRSSAGVKHSINIRNTIESIVNLHLKSRQINDIIIQIECERDLRASVTTESFSMIMVNLISNSCDAIKGKGTITITAEKENSNLKICVSDNGCGIEEEALEEIFNPFYTTKGTYGTGLGLYIVYNELEKMNGSISVKSVVGEGSEFAMSIPLSEA
ncbi:MAG: ATP-binding protein, partial [Bacillota bacterium]|nr:ATP-binding protein [Bacillota bacterium]